MTLAWLHRSVDFTLCWGCWYIGLWLWYDSRVASVQEEDLDAVSLGNEPHLLSEYVHHFLHGSLFFLNILVSQRGTKLVLCRSQWCVVCMNMAGISRSFHMSLTGVSCLSTTSCMQEINIFFQMFLEEN